MAFLSRPLRLLPLTTNDNSISSSETIAAACTRYCTSTSSTKTVERPSPYLEAPRRDARASSRLRLAATTLRCSVSSLPRRSIVEHQITRVITVMVITGNYSTGKILPESIFGYDVKHDAPPGLRAPYTPDSLDPCSTLLPRPTQRYRKPNLYPSRAWP